MGRLEKVLWNSSELRQGANVGLLDDTWHISEGSLAGLGEDCSERHGGRIAGCCSQKSKVLVLRTGRGFRQTDGSAEKENVCKCPDTFHVIHSRKVSALCFHSFLITA